MEPWHFLDVYSGASRKTLIGDPSFDLSSEKDFFLVVFFPWFDKDDVAIFGRLINHHLKQVARLLG
jgi:hypothetical protein